MLKYSEKCGAHRKLNEIVVAGSHDAGITGGAANVKTQSDTILKQAMSGVRVFDIRIAADKKENTLKTYHGAKIAPEKNSVRGAYGERLSRILKDAQIFVTGTGSDEFLILKFDKCANWKGIAEACDVYLRKEDVVLGSVNINQMTLGQLAGKVVVVFSDSGWTEAQAGGASMRGIHRFANLKGGAAYAAQFDGIQYNGKGGTAVWKPFGKISQNKSNQKDLMKTAAQGKKRWFKSDIAASDPEVLGMMYWTTTGIFESIEDRNDRMWKDKRHPALRQLWKAGVGDAVMQGIPSHLDPSAAATGPVMKSFIPNIVMIDFATEKRCATIASLNDLTPAALTAAAAADAAG